MYVNCEVAHKKGQTGLHGPVLRASTTCGRPERPPDNLRLDSNDYDRVVLSFVPPPPETW